MQNETKVRAFVARIIGWTNERAVERALRTVGLAATGRTALVLCGEEDMVPIARALHQRVSDSGQPFVVCDSRRGDQDASVRTPASRETLADAREAAGDGTLCLSLRRPPVDLVAAAPLIYAAEDMMLILCAPHPPTSALALRPAPVIVPPLASRPLDLPRIVDEYAADAAADLGIDALPVAEREWVIRHAASSLSEIDKATRRLAAVRATSNASAAAERLGMSYTSFARWFARRPPPPR